jgi:hypothetical protein
MSVQLPTGKSLITIGLVRSGERLTTSNRSSAPAFENGT